LHDLKNGEAIQSSWYCTRDWTFNWHDIPYSIDVPYKITRIARSNTDTVRWVDEVRTDNRVKGRLVSEHFASFQASLTVYCDKSDKNTSEIEGTVHTIRLE
jgi:hypothetical protein